MAVISIKNKTKSGSLLVGNEAYLPNDYESIATVTVGAGGSSTITFSSIPSTYKHLQVRGIARTDRTSEWDDYISIYPNNDTGSNYSWHVLYGSGSSVVAGSGTSSNLPRTMETIATDGAANCFSPMVVDILDYTNTSKYKTTRSLSGLNFNSSTQNRVGLLSTLWMSTSAITSLVIKPTYGTGFAQYTSFALYGIKG